MRPPGALGSGADGVAKARQRGRRLVSQHGPETPRCTLVCVMKCVIRIRLRDHLDPLQLCSRPPVLQFDFSSFILWWRNHGKQTWRMFFVVKIISVISIRSLSSNWINLLIPAVNPINLSSAETFSNHSETFFLFVFQPFPFLFGTVSTQTTLRYDAI